MTAKRSVRDLIDERKAAKTQPALHQHEAPAGYRLRGVSTLLDGDGNVKATWVKTTPDAVSPEAVIDTFKLMLEERDISPLAPIDAPTADLSDDLLSVYAFGDPHIGMLAWHLETGDDFDLHIAERLMTSAVDRLVSLSPPSRDALVVSVGDTFHSDNQRNNTTTGTHHLDGDSRIQKVFRVGMSTMTRVIERALQKHERVFVKIVAGNHDGTMALLLPLMLSFYYRENPRVVVDTTPSAFMWHRFGLNLFGIVHGDKVKMTELASIMAADMPRDWGETLFRHFYTGHIHHETKKDMRGCTAESLRTLAGKDEYHASHGYRSARSMNVDVWHRKLGFRTRHQVGVEELQR